MRAHRPAPDAWRPQSFFAEWERGPGGGLVEVSTLLLTGRECPWRCSMCDLWRGTLPGRVPPGAVPAQVEHALAALAQHPPPAPPPGLPLSAARHLKLYNSGSFFDPLSVPGEDYGPLAGRLRGFARVIVESHPALVGSRALRFRDCLAQAPATDAGAKEPRLEVAMGLETAHAEVLEKLNKGLTLAQFQKAAAYLRRHDLALRAFVLVQPPFLDEPEALAWAARSVEFAQDCGAGAVVLIPTRPGNGALEALAAQGHFAPPRLSTLEAALEAGLRLGRSRVFADLWNLELFADCPACFAARRDRLQAMNLAQVILPPIHCPACRNQSRACG